MVCMFYRCMRMHVYVSPRRCLRTPPSHLRVHVSVPGRLTCGYRTLHELGEGAYAQVKLCQHVETGVFYVSG